VPVRGMEIIQPGGKTVPFFMPPGTLPEDFGTDEEDEEVEFDDILADIDDYYAETQEQLGPNEAYILPKEWLVGFLTSMRDEGFEPDELDDFLTNVTDFLFYLDEGFDTPATLADLQGYHLSEFFTDFWDEHIEPDAEPDTSFEEKEEAMDTIFDLYDYLAEQNYIPQEVKNRVEQAADILFDEEDKITPIPRPK